MKSYMMTAFMKKSYYFNVQRFYRI